MKQREIKFRAWDRLEQEMIYFKKRDYINFAIMSGQGLIPMQYTGLKDRNGVDIYEGDIIKVNGETQKYYDDNLFEHPETVDFELTVKVIYNDSIAGFDLETIEADLNMKHWGFYGEDTHGHLEVIGNIYQHKHLLK